MINRQVQLLNIRRAELRNIQKNVAPFSHFSTGFASQPDCIHSFCPCNNHGIDYILRVSRSTQTNQNIAFVSPANHLLRVNYLTADVVGNGRNQRLVNS